MAEASTWTGVNVKPSQSPASQLHGKTSICRRVPGSQSRSRQWSRTEWDSDFSCAALTLMLRICTVSFWHADDARGGRSKVLAEGTSCAKPDSWLMLWKPDSGIAFALLGHQKQKLSITSQAHDLVGLTSRRVAHIQQQMVSCGARTNTQGECRPVPRTPGLRRGWMHQS